MCELLVTLRNLSPLQSQKREHTLKKKEHQVYANFSLLKTAAVSSKLVFKSAPMWCCPKSTRSVREHRLTDRVPLQPECRHEDSDPPQHGKASVLHSNFPLSVSHINQVKRVPELERSARCTRLCSSCVTPEMNELSFAYCGGTCVWGCV